MNGIILQNKDGQVLVGSRDVAKHFNKKHAEVIYAIEGREAWDESKGKKIVKHTGLLMGGHDQLLKMFIKNEYVDTRGRIQHEYLMNRDGFSLLVMGFSGKEALEWKLKYIEAFNKMEESIKTGNHLTEEERLKLQLFSKDASEVAYAHSRLVEIATAHYVEKIEEDKPKTIFADAVNGSHTSILVGDLAKLICQNGIQIGQKRLFEWMRENGYLIKRRGSDWNMPTQKSIEMGLLEIRESTHRDNAGYNIVDKTTRVTGKGQLYFINMFLEKEKG